MGSGAKFGLIVTVVATTLLTLPAVGHAAPPASESRVFKVYVDQKPAGGYRMSIRQDGDSATMTAQANVRVSFLLVVSYVYTFNGSEAWKGDRLTRLDSNTVDDKKRFDVNAVADGDVLRVRVNGAERTSPGNVWTTTYWRLPAARFRNQAIPLLDADTGKDLAGVGVEE